MESETSSEADRARPAHLDRRATFAREAAELGKWAAALDARAREARADAADSGPSHRPAPESPVPEAPLLEATTLSTGASARSDAAQRILRVIEPLQTASATGSQDRPDWKSTPWRAGLLLATLAVLIATGIAVLKP